MKDNIILNRICDFIERNLYQILVLVISSYIIIYGISHVTTIKNEETINNDVEIVEEIINQEEKIENYEEKIINDYDFEKDLNTLIDYLKENELLSEHIGKEELESLLNLFEMLYGFSKDYSQSLIDEILK